MLKYNDIGLLSGVTKYLSFQTDPISTLKQLSKSKYGEDPVRFYNPKLKQYMAFVFQSDLANEVLKNDDKYERKDLDPMLDLVMGEKGLITGSGDDWEKRRKAISDKFSSNIIAQAMKLAKKRIKAKMAGWGKAKNNPVVLQDEFIPLSMEIFCDIFFPGFIEITDMKKFIRNINYALDHNWRWWVAQTLPLYIPTAANMRMKKAICSMRQAAKKYIQNEKSNESPILRSLNEIDMDKEQTISEIITLILTGYETTAISMTWTTYLLAKHSSWQNRIHNEIKQYPSIDDISYSDLNSLDCVNAVCHEGLRMYPAGWQTHRQAITTHSLNGYDIPKGTKVIVSPFITQRHKAEWKEPDTFKPSRFLVNEKHKSDCFFPFGSGKHTCIGQHLAKMEIKLLLTYIVKNFYIKPKTWKPGYRPRTALRPNKDISVQFVKRADNNLNNTNTKQSGHNNYNKDSNQKNSGCPFH